MTNNVDTGVTAYNPVTLRPDTVQDEAVTRRSSRKIKSRFQNLNLAGTWDLPTRVW